MPKEKAGPGSESQRASDAIVTQLRSKIMTLELEPGRMVTEAYLADLLNCGRTPLREALQRLSQEHLITAVPRRGVAIAELSVLDYIHLVEAENGISLLVVPLAAQRVTDEQLSRLAHTLEASRQANARRDLVAYVELDFEYHRQIAAATGNRYLVDALSPLHRLLTRFTFLGIRSAGSAEGVIEDHQRVFDALSRRDPDAARQALELHHENARQRVRSAL
jgi:DNA-binding GntR family transcriptional regulator